MRVSLMWYAFRMFIYCPIPFTDKYYFPIKMADPEKLLHVINIPWTFPKVPVT